MNVILFLIASFLPLTFVVNEQKIIVNDERINNITYIQIEDLAKILNLNVDYEVNYGVIKNNNFKLKTSPNSFYIVYQTKDTLQIGQMTTPAIMMNNRFLIPVLSILNVMQGLNLINYEINKQNIILKGKIFDFQKKEDFPKIIDVKIPKLISPTTPEEKIFPVDTTSKKPANSYEVPKKLKRKGMK